MTEIKSSSQVAQSAVSGFSDGNLEQTASTVNLSVSNVDSMQEVTSLANTILPQMTTLVDAVKKTAHKIPKIASEFEKLDAQQAQAVSHITK